MLMLLLLVTQSYQFFASYGLKPIRLLCPWNIPGRILEWVAIPFYRGSSQPRDRTPISSIASFGILCLHLCLPLSSNSFLITFLSQWLFKNILFDAAKLRQSCPTLCHPIDSSPPGSPVPGILQARILE